MSKNVLVLGANSDVAKQVILLYVAKGYKVIAASRSTSGLDEFIAASAIPADQIEVKYFDAADFDSHPSFYQSLVQKPHIVIYAAGFLKTNEEAMAEWQDSFQMMTVNYSGAVSILNIIVSDAANTHLEKIVGLSSLSGVRGRKSNFIYGSTKSAFTQYLAGLRQHLAARKITVNVLISGYIRTKINKGLDLPESMLLEPEYVAKCIVNSGSGFTIVPGFKWKIIYNILRVLPEALVAKLP
ncbi:MAG: SDR family NAD(P)-dependent oxidoreductase [Cyclobacteriaceae bacterium]